MQYEPWVDTVGSYLELSKLLQERGFVNIPMGPSDLLKIDRTKEIPVADTKEIKPIKVMSQKKVGL